MTALSAPARYAGTAIFSALSAAICALYELELAARLLQALLVEVALVALVVEVEGVVGFL